jgi:hypothetical protein
VNRIVTVPEGRSVIHRFLQRLTEDFQHLALELGQLVEEEDAGVGQAHLPGRGLPFRLVLTRLNREP